MTDVASETRRSGNPLLIRISTVAAIDAFPFGYDTDDISWCRALVSDVLHATASLHQAAR